MLPSRSPPGGSRKHRAASRWGRRGGTPITGERPARQVGCTLRRQRGNVGTKYGSQEGMENIESDTFRVQNTTEGTGKGVKELG